MIASDVATRSRQPTGAVIRWVIPAGALDASFQELESDGALDREGIALWAGVRTGPLEQEVIIGHVVLLRGSAVCRARGFIRIAPEALNEITDLLESLGEGLYLAGQIHGHPPLSSTDLSPTDVMYGIRTPNYLSVVAPEYGRLRNLLPDCGVHVFEQGEWHRLGREDAERRISIEQRAVVVHTVTAESDVFGGDWYDD